VVGVERRSVGPDAVGLVADAVVALADASGRVADGLRRLPRVDRRPLAALFGAKPVRFGPCVRERVLGRVTKALRFPARLEQKRLGRTTNALRLAPSLAADR